MKRIPVRVQVWAKSPDSLDAKPQFTWKTKLITVAALSSAAGLIVGGGWLAVQLIVNPTSVSWLSQVLPSWGESGRNQPQTLAEIKRAANQAGLVPGQPVYFSTYPGIQTAEFNQILLPFLRAKGCGNPDDCAEIVELRVYRPAAHPAHRSTGSSALAPEVSYELLDRIAVTGPEELTAIAPLANTSTITQGSTRILPLTRIDWISSTGTQAPAGIWFHLYGEWKRGSRLLYGQVMHYDPKRQRLNLLQAWSSPADQLPHWQQVTGDPTAELVVNQSIGLEPQFQVYQLKLPDSIGQPIRLEAVSLAEAARLDRDYGNALLLARHGLWSLALQVLQKLKQQGHWSNQAEAQLNLIALHAKVTQAQANRDWASPTQQILAQIIDGRWSKALHLVKAAHSSGYDVESLLKANAERLWQRIEAARRVNPDQVDLQVWGTLVRAVQYDRGQAIDWLRQQHNSTAVKLASQTLALLEPLPDVNSIQPARSTPTVAPAIDASASLIGAVTPVVNKQLAQSAKWIPLESNSLVLPPRQVWYRIDVMAWRQRAHWQTSDIQQLRSLLRSESSLQIVAWQGTAPALPLVATVKAMQASGGKVSLLVSGDPLPASVGPTTIVAVTSTVTWAEPSASKTVTELAQNSVWRTKLIPQLWKDLQTANLITNQSLEPLSTIGDWAVQFIELTGDQTSEAMLTIEPVNSATAPRTVIFSQQGSMLYSDLQTPDQALVAIAKVDGLPMLILSTAQGLRVEQWSNQQFEVLE